MTDLNGPVWYETGRLVVNPDACLRRMRRNQCMLLGLSWWDKVTLIVLELQASYRKHLETPE